MALEIRKQSGETNQGLIRRFQKIVQQSGILLRARKIRFKEKKKSDQLKKRAALRREEKKREYERLKKLGKVE